MGKEALALVFAVKKFHQYLYSKCFILYTDHKVLVGLLVETKGEPAMALARIQGWALTMVAYKYNISHKPGNANGNVVALSCFPLLEQLDRVPVTDEVIAVINHMDSEP